MSCLATQNCKWRIFELGLQWMRYFMAWTLSHCFLEGYQPRSDEGNQGTWVLNIRSTYLDFTPQFPWLIVCRQVAIIPCARLVKWFSSIGYLLCKSTLWRLRTGRQAHSWSMKLLRRADSLPRSLLWPDLGFGEKLRRHNRSVHLPEREAKIAAF